MSLTTQALEAFHDFIHSGDPEIRKFSLLSSFQPTALTVFTYVMFVKIIGPALMKDKKPIKPLLLMTLYNFGLVTFYLYFFLMSLYLFWKFRWACFCGTLNVKTTPYGGAFAEIAWQLFLVKYVEMLDTVFLVLSKKYENITKLHVVHHAVVPVFAWTVLRSETRSYLSLFIFINSCVHILMYTYYGLALFGPKFQKFLWWKKYLTAIQILQFLFVNFYMLFMWSIGCGSAKVTLVFALSLSILFLVMFINFYRTSYSSKGKNSKNPHAEYISNGNSNGVRNGVHIENSVKVE